MSNRNTSQDAILEQLQCYRFEEQPDTLKLIGISQGLEEDVYAPLLLNTTAYELPPGMERHYIFPISLVFIRTVQNKRAVIRKVYKRSLDLPHVNIQMLVNFPPDFPMKDAITLWNFNLWSSLDAKVVEEINLSRNISTIIKDISLQKLQDISLQKLQDLYINYSFPSASSEFKQSAPHFPFILQSYLLQLAYRELHPTSPIRRILIVAPAHQVAYFISVLSKLLPQQLLRDITFNTYEHDLRNQQYDICGTDSYFIEENENGSESLLDFYINDFVLNVYESKPESISAKLFSDGLISPTLLERIVRYANFAAKSFSYNHIDFDMLDDFLQFMAFPNFPDLTVETFLDTYDQRFPDAIHTNSPTPVQQKTTAMETIIPEIKQSGQKKNLKKVEVKKIEPPQNFSSHDQHIQPEAEIDITAKPPYDIPSDQPSEPFKTLLREEIVEAFKNRETAEQLLKDADSRREIISLMQKDPAWVNKDLLRPIALLQTYSSDALEMLIWDVNDSALIAVREGNKQAFDDAYRVLMVISPEKTGSRFWHIFLNDFLLKEKGEIFIKQYRDVRENLINLASNVLLPRNDDDENLMFILIRCSIELNELHTLLSAAPYGTRLSGGNQANQLGLSRGWKYLLMRQLTTTRRLPQKILDCLEQYHENVRILFKEIIELPDHSYPHKWKTLQDFFNVLVNSHYHYLNDMFKEITDLSEALYPQKWQILQDFFNELVNKQYSDITIASILFETLGVFGTFKTKPPLDIVENLLTSTMRGIRTLKPAQEEELFKHYGLLCIRLSSTSPALWNITRTILASQDNALKWEYMVKLARMFDEAQETWIKSHREEIAVLLYTRIDSPIRLGMLLNLLMDKVRKPGTINEIVAGLGIYACKLMKSSEKKEGARPRNTAEVERGESCFALYVQFALHLISIQDDPPRHHYGGILLSNLLQDSDQKILNFITDEAKLWLPASLGQQWAVQKKLYNKRTTKTSPANAAPAPVAPVAPPTIPIASSARTETESSISPLKELDKKELDKDEEEKMLAKLKALGNKEGAWHWAAFRIKNYAILKAMKKRQLAPDTMQHLDLAYEFFLACKNAEYAPAPSWTLENTIVEISTKLSNSGNIPRFDKKEQERINLARQRQANLPRNENQKGKV